MSETFVFCSLDRNFSHCSLVITGLRKHDVCFLITVRPNLLYGTRFDRRQPFVDQAGLVYVRGCEVQGMLDDKGRVIEEGKKEIRCLGCVFVNVCFMSWDALLNKWHFYIPFCVKKIYIILTMNLIHFILKGPLS